MTLTLEPVTRAGTIPLIGMYGRSGSGKTHSALLLARGLAGPDGKIAIAESENKRSGAIADLIPGGFQRINLEPPFTPDRYIEAIKFAEASGVNVLVIDSLTHEWDGEGGILEMQEAELQRMAGDNWSKRESCKMASWIKPKMRHKALVAAVLRCSIPLVCCLRGQEKVHLVKDDKGKTQVETDAFCTPIFDSKFIFEMLVNLETLNLDGKPGCCRVVQWRHHLLLECLPKPGQQISVEHGAAIARWCAGSAAQLPAQTTASADKAKQHRAILWALLKPVRGDDTTWETAQEWLKKEGILAELDTVATTGQGGLLYLIEETRKRLK